MGSLLRPLLVLALLGALVAAAATQAQSLKRRDDGSHVGIRDFAFHPGRLTVDRGTTIVFANNDSTTHTATGSGFDTGRIKPGRRATVTLRREGTFAYHCSIHSFMHGKIVVG